MPLPPFFFVLRGNCKNGTTWTKTKTTRQRRRRNPPENERGNDIVRRIATSSPCRDAAAPPASPSLPSAATSSPSSDSDDADRGSDDPSRVLSRISIHAFPNLAICRTCLAKRIAVSNEVTEHVYRMEHVPSGQRNVQFTVEANCVKCKQKFSGRVLERLLRGGEGRVGGHDRRNKAGKKEVDRWDAVEATILLVGWIKRERRRTRRRRRAKKVGLSGGVEGSQRGWWETHRELANDDGECSGDECYSLSSDSCGDWPSNDDPRPRKTPCATCSSPRASSTRTSCERIPSFDVSRANDRRGGEGT